MALKDTSLQVEKAPLGPSTINDKSHKHVTWILKFQNSKDKEKILKYRERERAQLHINRNHKA